MYSSLLVGVAGVEDGPLLLPLAPLLLAPLLAGPFEALPAGLDMVAIMLFGMVVRLFGMLLPILQAILLFVPILFAILPSIVVPWLFNCCDIFRMPTTSATKPARWVARKPRECNRDRLGFGRPSLARSAHALVFAHAPAVRAFFRSESATYGAFFRSLNQRRSSETLESVSDAIAQPAPCLGWVERCGPHELCWACWDWGLRAGRFLRPVCPPEYRITAP
uniref:Uncharacterized protein n=1 Tax=Anopheles melas TaxID=34690 RepID=A0A182UDX4_9DIPT